jgi:hypothetical protein
VIHDLFEPNGAASRDLIYALNSFLSVQLPQVISAPSAELGAYLAKILREEIVRAIAARPVP